MLVRYTPFSKCNVQANIWILILPIPKESYILTECLDLCDYTIIKTYSKHYSLLIAAKWLNYKLSTQQINCLSDRENICTWVCITITYCLQNEYLGIAIFLVSSVSHCDFVGEIFYRGHNTTGGWHLIQQSCTAILWKTYLTLTQYLITGKQYE